MSRVYAKFRLFTGLLFAVAMLAGCESTGYRVPWGWGTPSTQHGGVVTSDPDSVPDIGWQTEGQREVLSEQNEAVISETEAAAEEQAIPAPVEAAPVMPARPKTVSVSLLVPLSGKKADIGQAMLNAAQMALFDIGSANFSLIPRDTKSTPEGAAAAAKAAVQDANDLILGPVFSEDLKAVQPIAASARLPVIAFTTDWTLGGGNTYIMGFLPFAQVARVVKYAQDKGYNRTAVFAPQTEYCDVVISTLRKSSMSVVRVNRYAPRQLDISSLVEDFATTSRGGEKKGPLDFDTLMLPLGSEGLRALATNMALHGVEQPNVKFIGTGLWDDATLFSDGHLHGGWFAAPDPRLRADFEKRYQENFNTTPPRLTSLAYDATALAAVLARSAKDGKPYTREKLTNPRGFAGIDGIFRFRPDGLSERGLAVLEMRPESPRVIDPAPTAFIPSGS